MGFNIPFQNCLQVMRSWVGGIVLVLAVRGGAKRCTLKRVISPPQTPCSFPTVCLVDIEVHVLLLYIKLKA